MVKTDSDEFERDHIASHAGAEEIERRLKEEFGKVTATIRALRRLDPEVKIIATSGLKAEDKISDAAQLGVKTFLPKPYTAEKLLKTVAAVLKEE
jgi:DNA-binding NarL/FixJ family response regulator